MLKTKSVNKTQSQCRVSVTLHPTETVRHPRAAVTEFRNVASSLSSKKREKVVKFFFFFFVFFKSWREVNNRDRQVPL